jgi:hypothetical protein
VEKCVTPNPTPWATEDTCTATLPHT